MRDKKDTEICVGDAVLVDDPSPYDEWNHSFEGTVDSLDREDWWVIVVDGDDDFYHVDPIDLEVLLGEEE